LNLASSGSVGRALLDVGGKSLLTECKTRFPSGIKYGEVVAVNGGNLKCKQVYFISLPDYEDEDEHCDIDKVTLCYQSKE